MSITKNKSNNTQKNGRDVCIYIHVANIYIYITITLNCKRNSNVDIFQRMTIIMVRLQINASGK